MQHTDVLRTYPGQIIGWRADGRPIRTIAGGAPDSDENAQDAGQTDGQDSGSKSSEANDSGQSADANTGQSSDQKDAAQKVEDLPEWAQKLVRDRGKEAADNRVAKNAAEQKQAETLDAIAKALGLKKDEKPDPAKLTEQLTQAQVSQRAAQIELAVHRNAKTHEGDPDALLDSRSFLAKVADLDPNDKDFKSKVDTAIKEAVTSNPKLKTGRASGASGVDHSGGAGERRTTAPRSLADSVTDHYGT